ncbi:bifunctional phosphopantothenoylcysteine decarboxylase/phosphopantothenate--cysteine ligase CoaBC [Cellulomonas bogoriensis]|uniref:Coenzyme A biosynthesis bifunctional protein CoaBC n=1 Tax=Cellulomonas bogoriensis 69B4 = DSM 16987 TaxID=1386082 RepID=A0A0A0C258_9CELL|nr:bifunctional phosphopantothenoylcysteine decarboxylase/phosphopantothenate--cysteine ligase CoaBC [Cellulomonas bogoriensis]KGM14235.1 phosphopantothenoylcysteine decarboxylase [Cellulomonas bogoriensis 69B4 = DSM 16987]
MRVLLGVGGGIAAYKSAILLRLLTESGHDVRVVPTAASLEFVGRATWEALSGKPATSEVFEDVPSVEHVRLGKTADLVVVAPATADLLARAATGRADDLLTAALLTARCPVLMAPAMHTEMWEHPATRENVATLRSRGVTVLDPAHGRLTGADTGPGRLPEPEDIASAALALLDPPEPAPRVSRGGDLDGRVVVVSAGGTREPLDPVRFIGNRSTGMQGIALARAAHERGAQVVLVAANVPAARQEEAPGLSVLDVETTAELRAAVREHARAADVVVMAAAVADFRPTSVAAHKIKREGVSEQTVTLTANPDVLAELARDRLRAGQVVVGFAAETGDVTTSVLEHGRAKARRKGADLLAVNEVGDGKGFGTPDNAVTFLDRDGREVGAADGTKVAVAHALWDVVVRLAPLAGHTVRAQD